MPFPNRLVEWSSIIRLDGERQGKTTVARYIKCSVSIDISTTGKQHWQVLLEGKKHLKMWRYNLVMAKEWQPTWMTNLPMLKHCVRKQPFCHLGYYHSIQVNPVRILLHHVVHWPLTSWKLQYGGAFTSLIRISLSLQMQTLGFCWKACFQIHT